MKGKNWHHLRSKKDQRIKLKGQSQQSKLVFYGFFNVRGNLRGKEEITKQFAKNYSFSQIGSRTEIKTVGINKTNKKKKKRKEKLALAKAETETQ